MSKGQRCIATVTASESCIGHEDDGEADGVGRSLGHVNMRERSTARRGRWWCTQRLPRSSHPDEEPPPPPKDLSSIRAHRVAMCGPRQRGFIKGGMLLGYHHGGGGVVLKIHQIHHCIDISV